MHPNDWFTADEKATEKADLLPFRVAKDASGQTFWNSTTSRYLEAFGYTYPDIVGSAEQVRAKFKEHYEWSVRTVRKPYGQPPADMLPLDLSKAQVYQYGVVHSTTHNLNNGLLHAQQAVLATVQSTKETAGKTAKISATEVQKAGKSGSDLTSSTQNPSSREGTAFQNLPAEAPEAAPQHVDESKTSREWFVDNIVQR